MKRAALILLAAVAGCKAKKETLLSQQEAAKVQARAEQAHRNEEVRATGVAKEARAEFVAEAEPQKAKVLNADARGCTWIESEGLVTVSEDDTRHQARAAAINQARRTAMQDFLGVKVKARTMDFQQEGLKKAQALTESLLLTTRQGRILDEKLLSEGYRDLPGCVGCRYGATIKTCILPANDSDQDFTVDLGLSRNRLVHGDTVKLNVTASKDCHLYVYDLWLDWEKVAMIVPNPQVPEVFLKAGQTWEYPNEQAKKAGVQELRAELPEGYTVSAETVRVICTKTKLPEKTFDAGEGFLAVLRRLNAGRVDWAEDAQAFTIYKQ